MKYVWAVNITPNESNLPSLYSSKVKAQRGFESEVMFGKEQGYEVNVNNDRTAFHYGDETEQATVGELFKMRIQ
ncbi:hypothetical protein KUA55_10300 [Enterococcus sp. ALS3]|uniref:Uncharacterized protein n=1 Tax=Enterococcus alishanensis TaxID=1303817 RepID=A0ABS6TDU2_9ENTE|nr:hypothetical protein [Enterococcus alishanensis]MBV7391073.1 hypothetical protein [Enterococcus alishanensis]